MPRSGKRFIDKKKALHFNVVFRSERDPLVTDERAPKKVLVEQKKKGINDPEARRKEQQRLGVHFEDEYNYLQHLKESADLSGYLEPVKIFRIAASQEPKKDKSVRIKLPESVFPSEFEEEVGVLNQAASSGLQPDLDQEVKDLYATFDENFKHEVVYTLDRGSGDEEDNDDIWKIVQGEMGGDRGKMELDDEVLPSVREEEEEEEEEEEDKGSEISDDFESGSEAESAGTTKTRFTNYSLTSSVLPRNQNLRRLDERFEEMFAAYDEPEVGALDMDTLEGPMAPDSELVLKYAEEFAEARRAKKLEAPTDETKSLVRRLVEESELQDEEMIDLMINTDKRGQWDCESILSTRSNLYNRPQLISETTKKIQVSSRTGLPTGEVGSSKGLTARNLRRLDGDDGVTEDDRKSMVSLLSQLSTRPKDESKEDKSKRKKELREYRRDRRVEKKLNTEAFKAEKAVQEKVKANRVALAGIKIC